eukprot:9902955-Alexandrium_andersonii.AAC.1
MAAASGLLPKGACDILLVAAGRRGPLVRRDGAHALEVGAASSGSPDFPRQGRSAAGHPPTAKPPSPPPL